LDDAQAILDIFIIIFNEVTVVLNNPSQAETSVQQSM